MSTKVSEKRRAKIKKDQFKKSITVYKKKKDKAFLIYDIK